MRWSAACTAGSGTPGRPPAAGGSPTSCGAGWWVRGGVRAVASRCPRRLGAGWPGGLPSVVHLLLHEPELQRGDQHQHDEHDRAGRGGVAHVRAQEGLLVDEPAERDRKSTRLNSSHVATSYAVFCLKKK